MTIFLTVYLDESNQDCNKICQLQKKKIKEIEQKVTKKREIQEKNQRRQ